jgi:ABC-type polysaccharide/polyol phosphate export permease
VSGGVGEVLADIWAHRFALRNLIAKDFRIRYRNMSLGVLWSVLNPLVMLGILLIVFTVVYPQSGQPYFPISVLLGLVSYNFLTLCIPAATISVIENAPLVKKVAFPRQILPISVVLSQSIQVLVQFGLVAIFVMLFRVPLTAKLLLVPPIVGILLLFVLGAGLLCSALSVVFRDTRYILESLLTVLFWLSPVFYPLSIVHEKFPVWLFGIYIVNPLAGCVEGLRRVILQGLYPDMVSLAVATAVSLATFLFGFALFTRLQRRFADLV